MSNCVDDFRSDPKAQPAISKATEDRRHRYFEDAKFHAAAVQLRHYIDNLPYSLDNDLKVVEEIERYLVGGTSRER